MLHAPAAGESTRTTVGPSLGGVFVASARAHADRTALVVDGVAVSYGELADAAAKIATALRGARPTGAPPLTAILASRTPSAYAGVLGGLLAGDAYVPLNPRFPPERLVATLEAAGAAAIVVDDPAAPVARELAERAPHPLLLVMPDAAAPPDWSVRSGRHTFVCRPDLDGCRPELAQPPAGPDDGAYLLFTSGSTGQPKGVLISNRNALAYLEAAAARYRPGPQDRFTQLFDFSFDLSVHDMFLCWAAGAALYCVPESAKVAPRDLVRRHELTFWFSVPSTVASMARLRMLRRGDFPTLRWSLFCGEPLPRRLATTWAEAAPNSIVENLYGPTEATIAFTAYRLPAGAAERASLPETVPIGEPFPGLYGLVLDEAGSVIPDGEAGELCLGGAQVADGYWQRPDLTLQRFAGPRGAETNGMRWYRTGDRVVATPEHGFVFLGRTDTQAKIGGHRVELQEIEEVVRCAANCDLVAALPWPVDADGLASGVLVFLTASAVPDEAILAACRDRLPLYMVPARLRRVADWPLNPNGKTDRKQLAALAKEMD